MFVTDRCRILAWPLDLSIFFILYEVVDIVYFPVLLIEYSDLIQDDYLDLDYIRFLSN